MNNISSQEKNTVFYISRVVGALILLTLAAVFLFSGYSKLYSDDAFNQFQWTFLDLGINSITFAGIIARLFIGFEFALGLFLLCHIFLKQFTYRLTIGLLVVFIVYLIVVLAQQGNNGSCGCFGDKIEMRPLQAIWKNVLMIAGVIALMFIYPVKPYKNQEIIALFIFMGALVTPFVLNPLDDATVPETMQQQIDLSPLYHPANGSIPSEDLRTGKHIIAFMSLTCPHCKRAAYLLQTIHRRHPGIPIFLVLNGSDIYRNKFFSETHAGHTPYFICKDTNAFIKMAGPTVPAIYWINNSVIERKSSYYQLDPKYMEGWLQGSN